MEVENGNKIIRLSEELDLVKEKLKISQSLVKIGFWELNQIKRIIFLSDEALNILDLKKDKHIISIEEFTEIVNERYRSTIFEKFENIHTAFDDLDIEFLLKSSVNDKETWIKVIANNASRSRNNPDVIMGIVQDISDQKNNEKLLKQAKERAEEADILKSAFLANMSHEIRTPLNAILGFSRLLTNADIEDKQRNEYSEYITSSANNLLNLIRDIVDVSKIEAGKILIEKSSCEINKVLKELKITFEKEKENQSKNHIEIILNEAITEAGFSIITDPYRFHQIMINLIGNALKFIEKGFIEFGYIAIEKEWLQFYVRDTGIGIPEDKIDLIFSRFGQIIDNKIKNPGGTGLGLSITKHLVERLGGNIWVESKPGQGTTFYFTLPFIVTDKTSIETLDFDEEHKDLSIGNIKVLAVEDDQVNMILLADTLKLYIKNIIIEKAYNGLEAIEKLRNENFDIIIMDIRMPYMDGYEATYLIRNEFTFPKNAIPILGLSAHALKEEIKKGKQIGMTDFLSKPIIPEELLLKIKKLVSVVPLQITTNTFESPKVKPIQYPEILNLIFLEKIFKNDNEKIVSTLKSYLEQIPKQLHLLKESCNDGKVEKQKNISHSLKSTFKYLGRNDLSEIAREIELELNQVTDKELITKKIKTLNDEWQIIEKTINEQYIGSNI